MCLCGVCMSVCLCVYMVYIRMSVFMCLYGVGMNVCLCIYDIYTSVRLCVSGIYMNMFLKLQTRLMIL